MKQSFLYNFSTALMVFVCISCAHGTKRAAMDASDAVAEENDLAQVSSGAPSEAQKEDKELATLEASKEEPKEVAKNEAPAGQEVSADVLGTELELASGDVKEAAAPVAEKAPEVEVAKVDSSSADDAVASMLELGNDEKSLALEEIKKVDVVPTVVASSAMVVASEDKVNADFEAAPAEAVSGDSSNNESLPAPGHERELSNDTKSNSEPAIETEPVPAPVKKAPRKQGSENKTKKNRIETVGYSKAAPQVVASQQVAPKEAVAKVEKKEVKKQEAKLASAEIAEFVQQHYWAVGLLAVISIVLGYRLSRRSRKQDENFPL